MKTLTFIFLFSASVNTYTQNNNSGIRDSIDAVFSMLNQDSISTLILLDKCIPQFDITKYESINDTLTHFNLWRGIYRSIFPEHLKLNKFPYL